MILLSKEEEKFTTIDGINVTDISTGHTRLCSTTRGKKESKSAIFENITKFLLGAAHISLHADVYDNTFMKHMGM